MTDDLHPPSTVIDVSVALDDTLMVWPGNPPYRVLPVKRLASGDDADVSELRMSSHAGTHLDMPGHVIAGGALSEAIDLDALVGPAWVVDLPEVADEVRAADLSAIVPNGETRILLRTRNSMLWERRAIFPDTYVSLSVGAAEWLIDRGFRLVGIDFLSIEARGVPGRPVHAALLGAGVSVLEGLDLRKAPVGSVYLVCLPLRIVGSDGAPARAILIEDGGA